jgi:hypothetical protein
VDFPKVLTTEIGLPCHRIWHSMRSLCIPGIGVEVLLGVPDVYLVSQLTSDLVNDYRDPAYSSILAFASPSGISAVPVSHLEAH